MRLKHPLRYYLTMQWVEVGGAKVLYTPAHETVFEVRLKGRHLLSMRIIGGYALVGHARGLEIVQVSKSYAGEIADEGM